MPIYEYACSKCGHHMEIIQKISDEPIKQCPNCKEETLNKLISRSGFRLKGSGWYETDFKGKDDKKMNLVKDESASTNDTVSTGAKESSKESSKEGSLKSGGEKHESKETSKKESNNENAGKTSQVSTDKSSGNSGSSSQ